MGASPRRGQRHGCASRSSSAGLPAAGLRRSPGAALRLCVCGGGGAGGPGCRAAGARWWPAGLSGPRGSREGERAGSLRGAAVRPPAPGDSSRSPPVTPGPVGGRAGGGGAACPAPRAAGRGCGRLRTASPAVPQCRALPLGPARGRWLPVAAAALAAEPASEPGWQAARAGAGLSSARGVCGARPAASGGGGGGGGARRRGIPLAMQTRRRLLPPEVSERRPALRPQAREPGVSRSPGPCRPERGPAGGRGGLRRLSRAAVIADTAPAQGLGAPGAPPQPAALVPRTPPRGERRLAAEGEGSDRPSALSGWSSEPPPRRSPPSPGAWTG